MLADEEEAKHCCSGCCCCCPSVRRSVRCALVQFNRRRPPPPPCKVVIAGRSVVDIAKLDQRDATRRERERERALARSSLLADTFAPKNSDEAGVGRLVGTDYGSVMESVAPSIDRY